VPLRRKWADEQNARYRICNAVQHRIKMGTGDFEVSSLLKRVPAGILLPLHCNASSVPNSQLRSLRTERDQLRNYCRGIEGCPQDPLFIDRIRDIVGLYLNPPDRALVLYVDERSQIQALDRTQLLLLMRPGQAERRSHDYKPHGTTSLFAALDVKTAAVIGQGLRRHRSTEFRKFLESLVCRSYR